MRLPWQKSKSAEKAAAQARTALGKFATPEREGALKVRETLDQAKQIETETKMFSGIAEGMTAIEQLVQARQKSIDEAIEAALEDYEPEGAAGNEWLPLIQQLIPYIPGIMNKFGINPNGGGSPSPPTAPPSPVADPPAPPVDLFKYINLAAEAHRVPGGMTALKVALPTAFEAMEKQGVDPEVFKQAVINISKVVK